MKKIILPLFLLTFFVFALPSFAQNTEKENPVKAQKQNLKTQLEEIKTQACKNLGDKIDKKISSLEENKSAKETVYKNLVSRINEIISKLKLKNVDTATLEKDLATLESLISTYWTSRDAVITKLNESKNFVCGSSQGEYRARIQEARTLQKTVLDNAKAIRDFVSGTLRQNIKNSKPARDTSND